MSAETEGIQVLRGSMFCMPFGENAEEFNGIKHVLHGKTFNGCWDKASFHAKDNKKELHLKMELDDEGGRGEKVLSFKEGQPVIYEQDIVSGIEASMPVAFHPTLQLPQAVNTALFDISAPLTCYTPPFPPEEAGEKGYSLLKADQEITDLTKALCVDGRIVRLMSCPISRGYEDVVYFLGDTARDFCYTAVTDKEKGYLYFQLKNPRLLSSTMLWISNGGRHYAPWNGRINSVLGIEEACSYFH